MLLLVLDGLLRSQTGVASYIIWVLPCCTRSLLWALLHRILVLAPPTLGSCNLLIPQDMMFVKGGVASGCTFTCLNSWKEVKQSSCNSLKNSIQATMAFASREPMQLHHSKGS